MGTPEFAVPSLSILVEKGFNVVAVITAPDRPAGRGLKLRFSEVKEEALKHNIPVLQPTNLKAPEFIEELKSYKANLQIVVAFRMLPEVVWAMPELGTFNLHGSLLPQYRGAAPINWAVMNGEKVTGCTTFFLKHKIDTGDIILQDELPIADDENVGSVYTKLMHKGAELVLKTVQQIANNAIKTSPQNEATELKEAPKIFKETCEINWSNATTTIYNQIRGLSPYPAAFTTLNDKVLKIYKAEKSSTTLTTPFISDNKTYLKFATGDGSLSVLELQLEGKKRMTVEEFLRGYKL